MLVLKKKPDESKSVLVTRAIFALLCQGPKFISITWNVCGYIRLHPL